MRKRINTRALVSIDPSNPDAYYRVSKKAHRESLAESHKEFEASGLHTAFVAVGPRPLTEEDILTRYTQVKVMGTWDSIRKYIGLLMIMHKENYEMK